MGNPWPWHKRQHRKQLVDQKRLNLEARGALNTVIDLIFEHWDDLDDDDAFIASWMNCDPRKWRPIKAHLIACGYLFTEHGKLKNEDATNAIGAMQLASFKAGGAGRASAAKRGYRPKEINDLFATRVQRPFQQIKEEDKKRDLSSLGKRHLSTELSTAAPRKTPSQEPTSQALRDNLKAKTNGHHQPPPAATNRQEPDPEPETPAPFERDQTAT